MHIVTETLRPRARVRIHHEQAYDFDEKRGLYVYRQVGEDQVVDNLVTDAGLVRIHAYIYATAASVPTRGSLGGGFNYIGLSNDAAAPLATDTSLPAELAGSGLTRALATVTLPIVPANQTTIAYMFTYLGIPPQGVQKSAVFDANVGGVMAHEVQFATRTLNTNDTLSVTYTSTIALA